MKGTISVTVIGQANSGKSTIMQHIIKALTTADIEVEPIWGMDGPPMEKTPEFEKSRSKAIAAKTKVVLTEFQAGRMKPQESPDDVKVLVNKYGPDYVLSVVLAGVPLSKNFGTGKIGQERARALAARFAVELDTEVKDTTPNEFDWRQPT
jgi:GTPase SAR1 family protein